MFVTHGSTPLGRGLAAALGELGAAVTTSGDRFEDRAAAGGAFALAPAIDLVVHVCVDDVGLVPQELADTDPDACGRAR